MPGTGKTATVREVIRELREELDFNVDLLALSSVVLGNQWNEGDVCERSVLDDPELPHAQICDGLQGRRCRCAAMSGL